MHGALQFSSRSCGNQTESTIGGSPKYSTPKICIRIPASDRDSRLCLDLWSFFFPQTLRCVCFVSFSGHGHGGPNRSVAEPLLLQWAVCTQQHSEPGQETSQRQANIMTICHGHRWFPLRVWSHHALGHNVWHIHLSVWQLFLYCVCSDGNLCN